MEGYRWQEMSLARQFALAGGVVMLVAMVVVGFWVSTRIEKAVVRNTATATAVYMESLIAPLLQGHALDDRLPPAAEAELHRILKETALGERVASFKLWRADGLVLDASNEALKGQRFPITENLRLAAAGEVQADFDETGDEEDAAEAALRVPLLEIYGPIRDLRSGEVVAVAEFYERGTRLERDIGLARLGSLAAVASVMTTIGLALFVIVLRGSRTIDRQVGALRDMAVHNLALRRRVQGAAARFAALNDQTLRRIGADLHDGPVQMMSFAALRLDALRRHVPEGVGRQELDAVEAALRESIVELRNISRGMSLPDLERKPVESLMRSLAEAQAARGGMAVEVTADLDDEATLPPEVKTCLYRVAQEGLTNAWRHGGGSTAELAVRLKDGVLTLSVMDRGPGFPAAETAPEGDGDGGGDGGGLGLAGLADRVESLGGQLLKLPRTGGGAELRMVLDLREAG